MRTPTCVFLYANKINKDEKVPIPQYFMLSGHAGDSTKHTKAAFQGCHRKLGVQNIHQNEFVREQRYRTWAGNLW